MSVRPTDIIRLASSILGFVEDILAKLGGVLVFALMLIIVSDVSMRYLFNQPFDWSLDLINLYLMALLFYLPLSATFRGNGHIAVDIVQPYLSERARRGAHLIVGIVSCLLFGAITYAFAGRTWTDWVTGAAAAGDIAWPSWASDIIVPIGAGLLTLRCAIYAANHLAALLGAENPMPLPPLSTEEGLESLVE
jgi:TRAP-type C4-dicarboxylate transport system permease small subunit